jgi:hypothetical protein
MATEAQWHLSADYFENRNCSVVCPCFMSKNAPPTSRPTEVSSISRAEALMARRSMVSTLHSLSMRARVVVQLEEHGYL